MHSFSVQPLSTRACGLSVVGRSPGSRAFPPRLPVSPSKQWLRVFHALAAGIPGHSGGSAPDSHRLPFTSDRLVPRSYSLRPSPCSRSPPHRSPARPTASLTGDTCLARGYGARPSPKSLFFARASAYRTSVRSLSSSASCSRWRSSRAPASAIRRFACSRSSGRPNVSAAFTRPSFRYQFVNFPSS